MRTDHVQLALKGVAMGIAEVIPGVSGGTIAFITGIYERLLAAVKAFDTDFLRLLGGRKFVDMWFHVDGAFLAFLLLGMAGGVVTGVFGVSHLLENHPEQLWGFFFGVIVASVIYVGRRVSHWTFARIALVLFFAVATYFITGLTPAEGSPDPGYVFLCGVVAISALILPGVSGSFVLLLLGMYTVIIPTLHRLLTEFAIRDLLTLTIFGLGCLTGLAIFSRVLTWTFRHYRNGTLAVLTGFMFGSLNKIWPWRNPLKWIGDDGRIYTQMPHAEVRILAEENVMPAFYHGDPHVAGVLLWAVVGFALVFGVDRLFTTHEYSHGSFRSGP